MLFGRVGLVLSSLQALHSGSWALVPADLFLLSYILRWQGAVFSARVSSPWVILTPGIPSLQFPFLNISFRFTAIFQRTSLHCNSLNNFGTCLKWREHIYWGEKNQRTFKAKIFSQNETCVVRTSYQSKTSPKTQASMVFSKTLQFTIALNNHEWGNTTHAHSLCNEIF